MSKKTKKYNKMGYYFDDEFDYEKLYEKNVPGYNLNKEKPKRSNGISLVF